MELYTLSRGFLKQQVIDKFNSAIWTERYYGDSDAQLVVPATPDMIQLLIPGTFLGLEGSNEVILIDDYDIKAGALTVKGSGLCPFLNNRFIRATAAHEDQYWTLGPWPAGQIMAYIVQQMCMYSNYTNGAINIGIPNAYRFIIPGLELGTWDLSNVTTIAVPYGPVFDALKDIGTTYQIGQKLYLESADDSGFVLKYQTYQGLDRTSIQSVNPAVRFSPQFDSLTNIEELQSMVNFKTLAYSFAPSNPDGLATTPGSAGISGESTTELAPTGDTFVGFDLRAIMTFEDDISTDQVGGNPATLVSILNSRASTALQNNKFVKSVDGEVTPLTQFQYGRDYNMGDIVEMQGNSGTIQRARITEYIRSQDNTGERAYPTVAVID